MVSTFKNEKSGEVEWVQEWYDTSYEAVPSGVMTAWRANNKSEDGKYILSGTASPYNPADGNLAYYVYLDMTEGKPARPYIGIIPMTLRVWMIYPRRLRTGRLT